MVPTLVSLRSDSRFEMCFANISVCEGAGAGRGVVDRPVRPLGVLADEWDGLIFTVSYVSFSIEVVL